MENFLFGSESFAGISEGIAENTVLERLSLRGNSIQWVDLARLLYITKGNSSLVGLELVGNFLARNTSTVSSDIFEEILRI